MIANLLGKTLFPRRQRWQREREVKALLGSVLVALIVATAIGLVIVWRNNSGRF
jgi:hypothetical protein